MVALKIALFIVSLPFLWLLWHSSSCHRSHFWQDMKQIAEG